MNHANGAIISDPVDLKQASDSPLQAAPHQMTLQQVVNAQVRQAVGLMFRGILMSSQNVPPELIVAEFCRVAGALSGEAFEGDLGTILKLRSEFKKAFDDGVNKSPIKPSKNMPPLNLKG